MNHPPQQPGGYGPQGYPQQQPGFQQPGYPPHQGYPHPQQQAYPQQPGYPPPGFPPPQQPGQPYPAAEPPQQGPKKSNPVLQVVGGCGCLLVAALLIGAVKFGLSELGGSGSYEAGQCIDLTNPSTTSPEYDTVDCGTPQSDYRIAAVLDSASGSCPSNDYSELSQRGRGSSYRLCLIYDARAGDCLYTPIAVDLTTKVPCGDPRANEQITTAVSTTEGDPACSDDSEHYIVYQQPPTTFCWKDI